MPDAAPLLTAPGTLLGAWWPLSVPPFAYLTPLGWKPLKKIPSGIVDHVLANRYTGEGHPGEHLLYLSQLCSLFKLAGVKMEFHHEEIILRITQR